VAKLLHAPTHAYALSDRELVRPQLRLVETLAKNSPVTEIQRMRDFCAELEQKADLAFAVAYPEQCSPPGPGTTGASLETLDAYQLYGPPGSQAEFAQDLDFGDVSFGAMFDTVDPVSFDDVSSGISGSNVWSETDPKATHFDHPSGGYSVYGS